MKLIAIFAAATVAVALPIGALADTDESRAFVLEALQSTLLSGNADAVDEYFATDYIQHNPTIANGIDAQRGLVGFMSSVEGFSANYVRVIADDDMVAIHATYEGFGPTPTIGFDVFRVEDGLIVEHWDNLIQATDPNPSGHTQIDGATEITDLDRTEENKAMVLDFVTRALITHEEIDYTDYINPTNYVQHNPLVGDGLDGFAAYLGQLAENGTPMSYSEVHYVIGEGNFVLTMSEGALGDESHAFYDLFRVEDGLIVEHWDVITPMPGADAEHNEAGKF